MKEFNKIILKFSGAQGLSNVLRIIAGLLVVKLIEPELYGSFTGPGIYLTYFLLFQLGINNGLSRELPYQLGSGKEDMAKEYASVGLSVNIIISLLTFLVFLGIGIYTYFNGELIQAIISITYSIVAIFNLSNKSYLPILYRTNNDFNLLSRIRFIFGFVNIFTVIFVYFWGIYGLCLRMILLFLVEFYLLYSNRPIRVLPSISIPHIKHLFKVGIPIYLVGHVNILWKNIVQNIILVKGGAIYLGFYALSNIISSAVGIIPNSFSQVVYPKMSIMFGKGESLRDIIGIVWTPMKIQIAMLLLIAISGTFLLPLVVEIILPKYSPGVLTAQWILFLPVVSAFGLFCNIYNVVQKQRWYLIALVSGASIGTAFIIIKLLLYGFNLHFFPQGLILGTVFQLMFAYYFLNRKVLNFEVKSS